MTSRLIKRFKTELDDWRYRHAWRRFVPPATDLSLAEVRRIYQTPNLQHLYFHWLFEQGVPLEVRRHREFYSQDRRGFGENEFHAMWYLLFKETRPRRVLEIGVYRGQVITLWGVLARLLNLEVEIHAISPFSNRGDEVSSYTDLDYYADVKANLRRFAVEGAVLHRGLSTDETMVAVIKSQPWDVIYIDGCHDYDVVTKDFDTCAKAVARNGIIVLDDAALYSGFTPPKTSFAGQPGPSRVAQHLDRRRFAEVIAVGHNRAFRVLG